MNKFSNMSELAARLGVDRTTVSHILNGNWKKRRISPATAERVLEFARKHHFTPNFLGQAISGKVKTDVALLMPLELSDHDKNAFFDLLTIISLKKMKYLIFQLGNDEDNIVIIERLRNFKVRKVILFTQALFRDKKACYWWHKVLSSNSDIEFLFYDYRYERKPEDLVWPKNVSTVGFDADEAVKKQIEFVTLCGYKTLHLFTGKSREAFPQGVECNLEIIDHANLYRKRREFDPGIIIGKCLVEAGRPQSTEAVMTGGDMETIGAITYLVEHGLRVPEDYAFISWDGLKISTFFLCPLTTLQVPQQQMLDFAACFITGESKERELLLYPDIRIGASMPCDKEQTHKTTMRLNP